MAEKSIRDLSLVVKKRGSRPRTGDTVPCDECGAPHYRKKSLLEKAPTGPFYCSRACQHAESARVDLVCETCSKGYNRFRSQGARGRRTFCSRSCQAAFGISSVSCCWPGCAQMIPCRMTRGSGRNGADEYKINLVKKGRYAKYPFCQSHAATVRKYLGESSRFTVGRSQMLADPAREYGVRALSSRFTRMVLFEKADCKCQICSEPLDWNAPPKVWQIDHIVPVFRGGKTRLSNLQILCAVCHDVKTAVEKSEVARQRHLLTRVGRWLTHHEKDLLIERLRARLLALGAPID